MKYIKQPVDKGERILSVTIHDCTVQTFRVSGNGGQKVNKTESGVRVIHEPSGAVGESRDTRSQHQNKRIAFIRMTETKEFKVWLMFATGKAAVVEQKVKDDMRPKNLRIEYRKDGIWTEEPHQ